MPSSWFGVQVGKRFIPVCFLRRILGVQFGESFGGDWSRGFLGLGSKILGVVSGFGSEVWGLGVTAGFATASSPPGITAACKVLDLRPTTSLKCEAVPRRARIQGS